MKYIPSLSALARTTWDEKPSRAAPVISKEAPHGTVCRPHNLAPTEKSTVRGS
jgi:hypothetical protein